MFVYIIETKNGTLGTWNTEQEALNFIKSLVVSDKIKSLYRVRQVPAIICPSCGTPTPEAFFVGDVCAGCEDVKVDAERSRQ